jgi:hypothetical protein
MTMDGRRMSAGYDATEAFDFPDLRTWLERSTKDRWEKEPQAKVAEYLRGEVIRWDRISDEKNKEWSTEVCVPCAVIDELRRERECARDASRAFIARRWAQ